MANWIWGTVQDPKSPMSEEDAVEEAAAAEAVDDAAAVAEAESVAPAVTVAMTVTVAYREMSTTLILEEKITYCTDGAVVSRRRSSS